MAMVADKVRKLLRLAQSSNPHEAALAAARAQELIDKHNLTDALLALDNDASREPEEDIEDFGKKGAPLDTGGKLDRWRWSLAAVILRANGCKGYVSGGDIHIIGRPSDADSVRYLYAYLKNEVERLTQENARGCGRTWANNYRLGVVETISRKLNEERERFKQQVREEASRSGGVALVRVDKALARIDQKVGEVEKWTKQNVRLYARGGGGGGRYDGNAREQGRKDGQRIAINSARGGIGSGTKALGNG